MRASAEICNFPSKKRDHIAEMKQALSELHRVSDLIETVPSWQHFKTRKGLAFIRSLKQSRDISVSDNCASLGTIYQRHSHEGKERFIVYQGKLKLLINGNDVILGPGNPECIINAEQPHSAEILEDCYFIAIAMFPGEPSWPESG